MSYSFEPGQIAIIVAFLLALLCLMIVARKLKGPMAGHRASQRHIHLVEDTAISPTERIKLVMINGQPYAIFTTKSQQPVVMPVDAVPEKSGTGKSRQAITPDKTTVNQNSNKPAGNTAFQKPFFQAMKEAQSRNPLLGLKK